MQFELVNANILDVVTDIIVLPANVNLKEGSGVSEVIFKAAGRKKLAKECSTIEKVQEGDAIPTSAYNLDSKYIIHAVVPRWIDGKHDEYPRLVETYIHALKMAEMLPGCKTIAFPLLASGNNGYSLELAFDIAITSLEQFESENLKKAYLVLYGRRAASLAREKGYSFSMIPEKSMEQIRKLEHQQRRLEIAKERKKALTAMRDDISLQLYKNLQDPVKRSELFKGAGNVITIVKGIVFKTFL